MSTTRKDLRLRIGGVGFTGDNAGDSVNEVHVLFPPMDKNEAINEAITLSYDKWLRYVEDESITIAALTYQYRVDNLTVPVGAALGIDNIWEHLSGLTRYNRVDPNTWSLRDVAGTLYLEFDNKNLPPIGRVLRLQYRARPSTLSADTSTLVPDEIAFADYICARSAGLLFRRRTLLAEAADPQLPLWKQYADEMEAKAEKFYGSRVHTISKKPATRSRW